MFSANQQPSNTRKDSVNNAEATGHFCWNLATWELREAVNASAQQWPPEVDEFETAGLTKEYATLLVGGAGGRVPMVKESPVKFECEYHSTVRLPGHPPMGTVDVVIGKVVGVHVADEVISAEGKVDVAKTQPIARCGYYDYAVVRETFEMIIPGSTAEMRFGLEGNVAKHRAHDKATREAA